MAFDAFLKIDGITGILNILFIIELPGHTSSRLRNHLCIGWIIILRIARFL